MSLLSLLHIPCWFTMSNFDGYTVYMHIGCLNCSKEFINGELQHLTLQWGFFSELVCFDLL